jgi:hypothetical protein
MMALDRIDWQRDGRALARHPAERLHTAQAPTDRRTEGFV